MMALRLQKVKGSAYWLQFNLSVTWMSVFNSMTSNSCLDISLKTSNLNFKVEQEEKSEIQQSQWDSPSGNQEDIF